MNDSIIKGINSEKILGVTTDNNFTFEEHINSLSKIESKTMCIVLNITIFITKQEAHFVQNVCNFLL